MSTIIIVHNTVTRDIFFQYSPSSKPTSHLRCGLADVCYTAIRRIHFSRLINAVLVITHFGPGRRNALEQTCISLVQAISCDDVAIIATAVFMEQRRRALLRACSGHLTSTLDVVCALLTQPCWWYRPPDVQHSVTAPSQWLRHMRTACRHLSGMHCTVDDNVQSINQSINQSKQICMAPYVASESEVHELKTVLSGRRLTMTRRS